ncbi:hypothetical protein BH20BAC1_BH20BAC1_01460 [soil metagenome]
MKRIIILLFLPLQFFGQDITGVWKGYLYSDTTKQYLTYEIAFSDNNNELSAFSYTVFVIDSVDNIGVKTLDVNVRDRQLELVDKKLIYDNYPEPPAKGVRTHISLHLSEKDDSLILAGPWHTNRTKFFESIHGNIRVAKIKPFEENKIIPKLVELGYASSLSFLPPDYNLNATAVAAATQKTTTQSTSKENANGNPVNPAKQLEEAAEEKQVVAIISEEPGDQKSVAINSNYPQENTLPQAKETANGDLLNDQPEKPGVPSQVIVKDAKNDENVKRNKSNTTSEGVVTAKDSRKGKPSNNSQDSQKSQSPEVGPENTSSAVAIKPTDVPAPENLLKKPAIFAEVPVIQAAAKITTRKTETIRSVDIKQDSIILSLYDNGEIDGDTVSVVLNGEVIMPMQGLRATAINKTIYLTPDMPDSLVLVMYAENLGSIPPNTGLLVIRDGEDIIEIRFSGDYQKNSAIILRKRKR